MNIQSHTWPVSSGKVRWHKYIYVYIFLFLKFAYTQVTNNKTCMKVVLYKYSKIIYQHILTWNHCSWRVNFKLSIKALQTTWFSHCYQDIKNICHYKLKLFCVFKSRKLLAVKTYYVWADFSQTYMHSRPDNNCHKTTPHPFNLGHASITSGFNVFHYCT